MKPKIRLEILLDFEDWNDAANAAFLLQQAFRQRDGLYNYASRLQPLVEKGTLESVQTFTLRP